MLATALHEYSVSMVIPLGMHLGVSYSNLKWLKEAREDKLSCVKSHVAAATEEKRNKQYSFLRMGNMHKWATATGQHAQIRECSGN